jgi:hypothetical protein
MRSYLFLLSSISGTNVKKIPLSLSLQQNKLECLSQDFFSPTSH